MFPISAGGAVTPAVPGGTLKHPKSTFQTLTCLNILTMSVLLFYGRCCIQEHLPFGRQLYMLLLLV